MPQDDKTPFKWAILGTGAVARKFALDLKQLDGVVLEHVASRDPKNAERFARDLGVTRATENYAEAVEGVDAVYIATPPAQHEDHALLAIKAGAAALIEKPFALDAQAARRIVQAARAANVFCMEAMWTRFQPLLGVIRKKIEAGEIGEIRGFDAQFLAANIPDPQASLFDPARGGGALLHRGIYPLSLARFMIGPVAQSHGIAQIGATGVDEDTVLTLHHDNGAISTLRASLRVQSADAMSVYGTKGTITFQGPVWRPTGAVLTPTYPSGHSTGRARRLEAFRESNAGLRVSGALGKLRRTLGRNTTSIKAPFAGNGYRHEAMAVMEAVQHGLLEAHVMPLSESIDILTIMDQARATWSEGAAQ